LLEISFPAFSVFSVCPFQSFLKETRVFLIVLSTTPEIYAGRLLKSPIIAASGMPVKITNFSPYHYVTASEKLLLNLKKNKILHYIKRQRSAFSLQSNKKTSLKYNLCLLTSL
jgi:hypothetical protein